QTKASAANKCDQGRRVNRSYRDRSRYPAPSAVKECPSAVVEWCIAPGLIFCPRPTPRSYVHPVPVTIWGPIASNCPWRPDITVIRDVAPLSIVVEVFVTGHLFGHILAAARAIKALISRFRPLSKWIRSADSGNVVSQLIGP